MPHGPLAAASTADGTWYVLAFRDGTDGSTQIGFTKNLAVTLPNSGTHRRYLGAFLRESGAIVAFTQLDNEFLRSTPVYHVDAAAPGTSAVTRQAKVPTGLQVLGIFNIFVTSNADGHAYASALDTVDMAPSITAAPGISFAFNAAGAGAEGVLTRLRTNTSGQFRLRLSTGGAGVTMKGADLGWVDPNL